MYTVHTKDSKTHWMNHLLLIDSLYCIPAVIQFDAVLTWNIQMINLNIIEIFIWMKLNVDSIVASIQKMHENGSDDVRANSKYTTRQKNIHSRNTQFCISIWINIEGIWIDTNRIQAQTIDFVFSIHTFVPCVHLRQKRKKETKKNACKSVNKFMKMFDEFLDCLLLEIHLTGSQMNEMLHDTQIRIDEHFSITIFRFVICDEIFFSLFLISFSSFQLDKYRFFNSENGVTVRGKKKKKTSNLNCYLHFCITDSINFARWNVRLPKKKKNEKHELKKLFGMRKFRHFQYIQWFHFNLNTKEIHFQYPVPSTQYPVLTTDTVMPLYNYVERKNLFKPSMELLGLTTKTTNFESSRFSSRPLLLLLVHSFNIINFHHLNYLITRANNNGDTHRQQQNST